MSNKVMVTVQKEQPTEDLQQQHTKCQDMYRNAKEDLGRKEREVIFLIGEKKDK